MTNEDMRIVSKKDDLLSMKLDELYSQLDMEQPPDVVLQSSSSSYGNYVSVGQPTDNVNKWNNASSGGMNMPDLSNIASFQQPPQQQQQSNVQPTSQASPQSLPMQQASSMQFAQVPQDLYIAMLQQQQQQQQQQIQHQQLLLQQHQQQQQQQQSPPLQPAPIKKKRGRPPNPPKDGSNVSSDDPSQPPAKKPKKPTARELGTQFSACVTQYQNDMQLWNAQRDALEHKCSESELRYKEMDRVNREAINTLKEQMKAMEKDRDLDRRFKEMERVSRDALDELKSQMRALRTDHGAQIASREKMHQDLRLQNTNLVRANEEGVVRYKVALEEGLEDKRTILKLREENMELERDLEDCKRERTLEINDVRRQMEELKGRYPITPTEEEDSEDCASCVYNPDLPVCTSCFGCQSTDGWKSVCPECPECWDEATQTHVSPYDKSRHRTFAEYESDYLRSTIHVDDDTCALEEEKERNCCDDEKR